MTIAVFLKVILFILAGASLLVAFRMLLIGMRSRNAANRQFFNVGRLEARRKVFSSMLSTIGLVVLALLFAIGALFVPDDFMALAEEEVTEEAVASEEVESAESVEASDVETDAEPAVTEGSDATEPEVAPTATLTPIPTETPIPTPAREFVYVDSPIVGLYIRDLPEGDIMDVLDHQARLTVAGESTIVNGINWILVMTDEEREGWVAEQFTTKIPPADDQPVPENLDSQDSAEEQQDG